MSATNLEVFKAIATLSPDIISLIDADGTLLFNSSAAQRIHGYSEEDLKGKNTLEFIHDEDRDLVVAEMKKVLSRPGALVDVQYRYRNKDGSFVWMEARAYNQVDNPEIKGIITISRDITERKHLELGLKKSLKAREEFISIASHEMRTPITSLKLQLELMKRKHEALGPEELETLLEEVESLGFLVEELLQEHHLRGNFDEVNFSELCRKVLARMEGTLRKASMSVSSDITPGLFLNGDERKLKRVIINLIHNAVKYASGSTLEIHLHETLSGIELVVKDQGPGIRQDDLERIFNPFERGDETSRVEGMGLGLYISRQIIQAHGGEIKAESTFGQGATFVISFPWERR